MMTRRGMCRVPDLRMLFPPTLHWLTHSRTMDRIVPMRISMIARRMIAMEVRGMIVVTMMPSRSIPRIVIQVPCMRPSIVIPIGIVRII